MKICCLEVRSLRKQVFIDLLLLLAFALVGGLFFPAFRPAYVLWRPRMPGFLLYNLLFNRLLFSRHNPPDEV